MSEIKTGDRVVVLTYQDARPAYHGKVVGVKFPGQRGERLVVRNDETSEDVAVPTSFIRREGPTLRVFSGEHIGALLESSFPMELEMSGGGDPVKVDHVVCETQLADPGDGSQHEFRISIGSQWFKVTVEEMS